MQKKKTILLTTSILIILSIILLILNTNKPMPQNITEQAKATYTTEIGTQTYDITNAVLEPEGITPTISAGMIPVKWNGENFEITTRQDKQWYDYAKGQPAYIMLNDGYYKSELEVGIKEDQLMENNEGTNITHPEDLGTICMWIPRFAYNAQGEILYIKQAHSVAGTYTMPEIFIYETEKRDLSLAGIWVECKPLANTSEVNTKINKMNGKNNTYGFLANTIATNANNETTYKATIETYNQYIANVVGATSVRNTQENLPNVALTTEEYPSNAENNDSTVPQITDQTNTNRTILKITNTNQPEPIKGKAYYDETEEKIKIEVTYRTNAIAKILDKNGKELSTNSTVADTGDEVIGNGLYKYLVIDNKGNIEEITTKVEGLKIYVIPDLETLKQFRDEVNEGNTFYGITVIQTADISMNEGKYTIDEETGEITFEEEAEQWTPIADYAKNTSLGFKGIYNGQGHTISGIYINNNSNYQGLFGRCIETSQIQNLGVKESSITGNEYVGGIAGYIVASSLNYDNTKIIQCYNDSVVKGTKYVGGIVGRRGGWLTIEKCYNSGEVYGSNYIGGIIGEFSSNSQTLTKCYNIGKVVGENYVGGIVGYADNGYNSTSSISQCYNIGEISGTAYIGGIIGRMVCSNSRAAFSPGINMAYCYNRGDIDGSEYVGGIMGEGYDYTNSAWGYLKVSCCYNVTELNTHMFGRIYASHSGTGRSAITISNCWNFNGAIFNEIRKISGYEYDFKLSSCRYLKDTAEYGILNLKSNEGCSIMEETDMINEICATGIFVEDTEGINNGYPLLAWQVEATE